VKRKVTRRTPGRKKTKSTHRQARAFGNLVRKYRVKRNMNQTELADKLGISAGYLSDIECGRRGPVRAVRMIAISHILDLPMKKLMGVSGQKTLAPVYQDWKPEEATAYLKQLGLHEFLFERLGKVVKLAEHIHGEATMYTPELESMCSQLLEHTNELYQKFDADNGADSIEAA
jgi:transcriptional regulator with XRE-family HTH domain